MASNQAVMILLVAVFAAVLPAPALASAGGGMKPKANERDVLPNSNVKVPSTYSKYSRNLTDDQDAGESGQRFVMMCADRVTHVSDHRITLFDLTRYSYTVKQGLVQDSLFKDVLFYTSLS